jgi:hypothetical protein
MPLPFPLPWHVLPACFCSRLQLKSEWNNYESSYGKEAGEGIKDRSKTTQLVDVFYSLVSDNSIIGSVCYT